MKHLFIAFFLSIFLLTTSCKTLPQGPNSQKESANRAKIAKVDNQIAGNNIAKIDTIAELAYGTDYALGKITDPPREVSVAKDINQRVISISGSPTIEKMKEMQETIDKLTSSLLAEQQEGKKKLSAKDVEIAALQDRAKVLIDAKNDEIQKYMTAAAASAQVADFYKLQLDAMDQWMGLGAVWYGLKKFVVSSMWILGISGLLFIVLRILAMSNPIASAVFSVFSVIAGYVIKAINALIPRAIEFSGNIATATYNTSKVLLKKIVDNIQSLKQLESKVGHDITLKEMFLELEKSLDDSEKEEIKKIKKELGY